jgi:hypothetical protein
MPKNASVCLQTSENHVRDRQFFYGSLWRESAKLNGLDPEAAYCLGVILITMAVKL